MPPISHLLKVGPDREDFVYEIFNRENVILSKSLFNHLVVGERYSLLINPTITALVDQLADSLEIRLAGNG
jgi:hypothetical protein